MKTIRAYKVVRRDGGGLSSMTIGPGEAACVTYRVGAVVCASIGATPLFVFGRKRDARDFARLWGNRPGVAIYRAGVTGPRPAVMALSVLGGGGRRIGRFWAGLGWGRGKLKWAGASGWSLVDVPPGTLLCESVRLLPGEIK